MFQLSEGLLGFFGLNNFYLQYDDINSLECFYGNQLDKYRIKYFRKYKVLYLYKAHVSVSQQCHNRETHTGRFKTTDIYSPQVLEAGSPKSRCRLGHALLESLEQDLSLPIPNSDSLRCFLAHGSLSSISVPIFTQHSPVLGLPFSKATHHIRLRVHTTLVQLHLNSVTFICNDLFSNSTTF